MNAMLLPQAVDTIATLIERGDIAGAKRQAQIALNTLPPYAEIWRLLAITQIKSDDIIGARRSLQHARTLDPGSIEVLCNLASVESSSGETENAMHTLQHALVLAPEHTGALKQLGRLRQQIGDYTGAAECLERSLRIRPDDVDAWLYLASTRGAEFRWSEAEGHVRRALTLAPRSADGWYLLAYIFERQGKLRDASATYKISLDIRPTPYTAHNLGLVLDQLGDWQGSVRELGRAFALAPNLTETLAHLVFGKRRLCDWRDLPMLSARLATAVDEHDAGVTPFSFLVEDTTLARQLECARTFARQFSNVAVTQSFPSDYMAIGEESSRNASVRVGFVSSGLAQHATGLLIVELMEHLRSSNLTTVAFATTGNDRSDIRHRLEAAFHEFRDVSGWAPDAIVESIRNAHCDILIDMDGYCMNSIPRVFARKPAPIQVNWLAYPGSLGAPWYDYLIADRYLIADAHRIHYDEKIAWLPRCYQPTDTTRIIDEPPSREACGLPREGFVYCCFNNNWKFTPRSFALWMHILHAVPGSALWLLDGSPGHGIAERLRDSARQAGIDAQRLVFSPKLKHADYLARYRHADLFLDTSPYNAHTTASDALYAGCPVLTCPGETFASRVAGSLNHQLGFDQLSVDNDEAYVTLAVELALQPPRLSELRTILAKPACRARLFDMRAYANDFAQLLTQMVKRKRRGEAATDISL